MKSQTLFHYKNFLVILFSFFLMLTVQADQAEEELDVLDKEVENEDKIAQFLGANFSYSNMSINYLDWTDGTNDRSGKKDFFYFELEGGASWDWGDFYFFMDFENPQKGWYEDAPDNTRFVFKPIFDIKLGNSNWNFHFQDYYLNENNFYVSNMVPGISYKYVNDNGVFFTSRAFLLELIITTRNGIAKINNRIAPNASRKTNLTFLDAIITPPLFSC